jgi:hypothetical protein
MYTLQALLQEELDAFCDVSRHLFSLSFAFPSKQHVFVYKEATVEKN